MDFMSEKVGCTDGINCFLSGTKITTDDGLVNIEDIQVGDYVLAENPETGEQDYKEVVATFVNKT